METMEKQVTVVVKGCEIYNGSRKYAEGAEYTCGETEAARLVQAGCAVLKSGAAQAGSGGNAPPLPPASKQKK
jgi:hypothetical protein